MDDLPILPYNGTSGWLGSDTSKDRAISMDSSGDTEVLQKDILDALKIAGKKGLTWHECDWVDPDNRHGSVSGALSTLHKHGLICRLKEPRIIEVILKKDTVKKSKRKVYVLPEFVDGRETEPYRESVTKKYLIDLLIDLKTHFHYREPEKALLRINEELKKWIPKKTK